MATKLYCYWELDQEYNFGTNLANDTTDLNLEWRFYIYNTAIFSIIMTNGTYSFELHEKA